MPVTTHAEVLFRAPTIWGGLAQVPYSMFSTASPTGHRCDCSGYVCAVLGLPTPGLSTVTMVTGGSVYEISWDEAVPGDIWGMMGPGTEGANGHTAIIVETPATHGRWVVIEQRGGVWGPTRSSPRSTPPKGYKAYRYKGIVIQPPTPTPDEEDDDMRPGLILQDAHSIVMCNFHPQTGERYIANIVDGTLVQSYIDLGWKHVSVASVGIARNLDTINAEYLAALKGSGGGGVIVPPTGGAIKLEGTFVPK